MDGTTAKNPVTSQRSSSTKTIVIATVVSIAIIGRILFIVLILQAIVVLFIVAVVLRKRNRKKSDTADLDSSIDLEPISNNQKLTMRQNVTEISAKDVVIRKKIGEGYFAEVYKGTWSDSSIALKKLKSHEQFKEFVQEAKIIESLLHPNILRFLGFVAIEDSEYLVTEFANGGSLDSYLKKNVDSVTQTNLITMCKQSAAGMSKKSIPDLICQ